MTDIEKRRDALEEKQRATTDILGKIAFQIGVALSVCKNHSELLTSVAGFLRDVQQWLQPSKN